MNIYIICAVRNATPERVADIRAYANAKRAEGHHVHFPPDDAPQDDPTGEAICRTHLKAMQNADEVHVFWDVSGTFALAGLTLTLAWPTRWGTHWSQSRARYRTAPRSPTGRSCARAPDTDRWRAAQLGADEDRALAQGQGR
jgi:hypothetical protein